MKQIKSFLIYLIAFMFFILLSASFCSEKYLNESYSVNLSSKTLYYAFAGNLSDYLEGKITDDRRIRGALPTIEYLAENGAKIILASHMGRPKGKPDPAYSLKIVADRLSELLGMEVLFVSEPEVTGPETKAAAAALKPGEIMLIENVRY